ncbi:MAG: hypothetical protein AAGK28_16525, partial [Pseudomonadota bacterium]
LSFSPMAHFPRRGHAQHEITMTRLGSNSPSPHAISLHIEVPDHVRDGLHRPKSTRGPGGPLF